MTERLVHAHALVLWGGRLQGAAPRTTLFELCHDNEGNLLGRKVDTKRWRKVEDDEIVAEFNFASRPSKAVVNKAKRMFHKTWHKKQAQGVQP